MTINLHERARIAAVARRLRPKLRLWLWVPYKYTPEQGLIGVWVEHYGPVENTIKNPCILSFPDDDGLSPKQPPSAEQRRLLKEYMNAGKWPNPEPVTENK